MNPDVLIVGAGPTGLVLALWLARLNVRVRIIEKADAATTTSRALAVQARTLELYAQMGLADTVVSRGRRMTAANLWVAGRQVAHAPLGDMGAGISPYPFALIYPQDEHERLLTEHLADAGITIERQTALVDYEDAGDRVRAPLRLADGSTHTCEAAYLAGCDGAHSAVRHAMSIGFPGGAYDHLFYVADVDAGGDVMNGELHVAFDETDFLAVFPLKGERRARLVGTIVDASHAADDSLSWNDVSHRAIDWLHVDVARVNWFSTYRVHHRVADRFRSGRAFLLGDAAHIHSPVGGQGMNTGIGDAINLAWKLAAVCHSAADPGILDTYATERMAFARRLVATTDEAFSSVTSTTAVARAIRLHLVPFLVPTLFSFSAMRGAMFRVISQTSINYRRSALSDGRAGQIRGGDRLPWIESVNNFALLKSLAWQLHVYGEATTDTRMYCEQHRLPLHVFAWHRDAGAAGIEEHSLYLVRPDGYVGFATSPQNTAALSAYVDTHALVF